MLIVFGILGGWLLLSVVVCLVVGFAIRQADGREAVEAPDSRAGDQRRRKRPLSVA